MVLPLRYFDRRGTYVFLFIGVTMILSALVACTCTLHPIERPHTWDKTELYTDVLIRHIEDAQETYKELGIHNNDMYSSLGAARFYSLIVADLHAKLRDAEMVEE